MACCGCGRHIVALEKDSDIFNVHLKSMGDPAPSHSTPWLVPMNLDEPLQKQQRRFTLYT